MVMVSILSLGGGGGGFKYGVDRYKQTGYGFKGEDP